MQNYFSKPVVWKSYSPNGMQLLFSKTTSIRFFLFLIPSAREGDKFFMRDETVVLQYY